MFALFLANYYKCLFTDNSVSAAEMASRSVGDQIDLAHDDLATDCNICRARRPARAHHCRRCGTCILQFDHHCIWIANCVGYRNRGHFTRCLLFGTLTCIFMFALLLIRISDALSVEYSTNAEFPMSITLIVGAGVNLTILTPLSALLAMMTYNHMCLICSNQTSVELLEMEDAKSMNVAYTNPFDLGYMNNLEMVFGRNLFLWWLPQDMEGDGYRFNTNSFKYN